jgi:hypothetical protein
VQLHGGLVILRLISSGAAPAVYRMPSWSGAELGATKTYLYFNYRKFFMEDANILECYAVSIGI